MKTSDSPLACLLFLLGFPVPLPLQYGSRKTGLDGLAGRLVCLVVYVVCYQYNHFLSTIATHSRTSTSCLIELVVDKGSGIRTRTCSTW
jgi:hypothetical protein